MVALDLLWSLNVALALAAGTTFEQAARLANYAGGIVVMKRGTATVSASELRQAVSSAAVRAKVGAGFSRPTRRSRRG